MIVTNLSDNVYFIRNWEDINTCLNYEQQQLYRGSCDSDGSIVGIIIIFIL